MTCQRQSISLVLTVNYKFKGHPKYFLPEVLLKIHEYQAKQIFREFAVPVPEGEPCETEEAARKMLGSTLVTPQTGPEGRTVNRVLIEQGLDIEKELYAGIAFDRSSTMDVFMVSTEGGVEIEKVAAEAPEK